MIPDKYRTATVKICDGIADDIRVVAAWVSSHPLPPHLESALQSLVAHVAAIGDAQAERDLRDQRDGAREDYR